jgi:hypothetical protein
MMCSRDSVPPKKPCPFLLPRGLIQGGTTCSLGVRASQVLPQPTPEKELFPLFRPLPSFPATRVAVSRQSGSQGVEVLALWHLPPKRAPTRVAFFTDGTVPPLRTNPRRGVFFPLKIPRTLTGLRSLSLRPRSTRLSEGGTAIPGAPCGDLSPVDRRQTEHFGVGLYEVWAPGRGKRISLPSPFHPPPWFARASEAYPSRS